MKLTHFFPDHFKYKCTSIHVIGAESFSGEFRVSIKCLEDFQMWLHCFQEKSNTTWILRRSISYKESSLYVLNRDYICHHSSYGKKKQGSNAKNKNCKASFTIRIKRNNYNIRYKDPYVKEGLTGILKMNFMHTHSIKDAQALKWLKRSEETKNIFLKYFSSGLSPAAAIRTHEANISLTEGHDALTNSQKNPPKAWVYALHEKWVKGDISYCENLYDNIIQEASLEHESPNSQQKIQDNEKDKSSMDHVQCSNLNSVQDVKKQSIFPETDSSIKAPIHSDIITFQSKLLDKFTKSESSECGNEIFIDSLIEDYKNLNDDEKSKFQSHTLQFFRNLQNKSIPQSNLTITSVFSLLPYTVLNTYINA